MRLLSVGDIAWDVLFKPAVDLVWGSDVYGSVSLQPGGGAANLAVWATRLGASVTLVGKLGDDALGTLMVKHLQREGLGGGLVVTPGGATTRIGVFVAPRGERSFIIDEASQLALTAGDLSPDLLDHIDVVFFNGYAVFAAGSCHFIAPLLAEARRRGTLVAFDPSSFHLVRDYGGRRLLDEVGPLDFLLLNTEEAEALLPGEPIDSLTASARLVIVKRGVDGATGLGPSSNVSVPAPQIEVVDTNGAGDGFDAAFLVSYVKGEGLECALRAATALGARVASQLGAQPHALGEKSLGTGGT